MFKQFCSAVIHNDKEVCRRLLPLQGSKDKVKKEIREALSEKGILPAGAKHICSTCSNLSNETLQKSSGQDSQCKEEKGMDISSTVDEGEVSSAKYVIAVISASFSHRHNS